MDIYQSLKFLILIQVTFRLSLLSDNKDTKKLAIPIWSYFASTCTITFAIIVTINVFIRNWTEFFGNAHWNKNPIDTNHFTSLIVFIPVPLSVFCVTAIFIASFFVASKEILYYRTLCAIDEKLQRFVDLRSSYKRAMRRGKLSFIFFVIVFCIQFMPIVAFIFFDLSKLIDSELGGIVQEVINALPTPKLFKSNLFVMCSSIVVVYLANMRYLMAVQQIVWRTKMLNRFCEDTIGKREVVSLSKLLEIRKMIHQVLISNFKSKKTDHLGCIDHDDLTGPELT